jgi:hypothetical protein
MLDVPMGTAMSRNARAPPLLEGRALAGAMPPEYPRRGCASTCNPPSTLD